MNKFATALKKQKMHKKILKLQSKKFILLFAALAIGGLMFASQAVYADRYDNEINALREENSQTLAKQKVLESEEGDLTTVINNLKANISSIEKQIEKNQAARDKLAKEITEAEAEIERQREMLSASVKQLYLDGQISTLEKLATSRSLSHYADKEQYRLSVQNNIDRILDEIKELKKKQEAKKADIEKLLADQKEMQSQLAAQKAKNDRLLGLNQQQQKEYESEMGQNSARIAELRRQQAIENARYFVGGISYAGTSNYPWPNVPFPNTLVDPWGMYKRQCVSYAAWKVASTGRYMPYWGGRGNANLWDNNARAAGIPVSSTPKVGSVAVSNAGTYGHVMYVEAVHGDGTISISQYNAGWDGRYSEGRRSTAGLVFIYF